MAHALLHAWLRFAVPELLRTIPPRLARWDEADRLFRRPDRQSVVSRRQGGDMPGGNGLFYRDDRHGADGRPRAHSVLYVLPRYGARTRRRHVLGPVRRWNRDVRATTHVDPGRLAPPRVHGDAQ